MTAMIGFFIDNFPTPKLLGCYGPFYLSWAWFCLSWAGYLKVSKNMKTGYTRKIFHFLIFMSAVLIQALVGTRHLCLFGIMTSLAIFYALIRGRGHRMYEAMAREKDAPFERYYIIAPYLATLVGGIISNAFFVKGALIGYLVTGLGDAIGEPVGTRFGRHPYQVPSLRGIPAARSIEGSLAVFAACCLAITIGLTLLSGPLPLNSSSVMLVFGLALISTLIEAISPHGWDNLTMQVIPAMIIQVWLA